MQRVHEEVSREHTKELEELKEKHFLSLQSTTQEEEVSSIQAEEEEEEPYMENSTNAYLREIEREEKEMKDNFPTKEHRRIGRNPEPLPTTVEPLNLKMHLQRLTIPIYRAGKMKIRPKFQKDILTKFNKI